MEKNSVDATQGTQQKTKYVFMSGNNLDKRDQVALCQLICKDRDIRRLIRKSKLSGILKKYLIIIATYILSLLALFNFIPSLSGTLSIADKNFLFYYVPLINLFPAAWALIKQCRLIRADTRKVFDYVSLKLHKLLPRNPIELWHLYPASIIDAQIVLYVQRLLHASHQNSNESCRLIYAGIPYAQPFLLDSIDVIWSFQQKKHFFIKQRIRHHFRKYYREYAVQSIVATAIDRMNKVDNSNRPIRQTSDCAFGILFASRYFKVFKDRYCKTFDPAKDKIFIDLASIPEEHHDVVKNTLQYLTNPHFFTFDKSKAEGCPMALHINRFSISLPTQVVYGLSETRPKHIRERIPQLHKKIHNAICANKPIHIPVKRLFLRPVCNDDNPGISNSDPWILSDLSSLHTKTVVVLGGAEQSLLQCHLINRHRWEASPSAAYHIGFAENEFDNSYHYNRWDFLVGVEGFVYGHRGDNTINPNTPYFNEKIHPVDNPNKSQRNRAEVIKIYLDHIPIVLLYGYHAVSTKIAAAKYFLLNSLVEEEHLDPPMTSDEMNDEKKILFDTDLTGNAHQWNKCLFFYKANERESEQSISEIWQDLLIHWDNMSPLDNPLLDPRASLRSLSITNK